MTRNPFRTGLWRMALALLWCAFGLGLLALGQERLDYSGTWEETDGDCKGSQWRIVQQDDRIVGITAEVRCGGVQARWEAHGIAWRGPKTLSYACRFEVLPSGWANGTHVLTFFDQNSAYLAWQDSHGRRGSTSLRRVKAPPPKYLEVGGVWEEVDGPSRGSRWQIVQQGREVGNVTAEIRTAGGETARWSGHGFAWKSPRELTYQYRFTICPPGWANGFHQLIFTDGNTAELLWGDEKGNSGTVRLRRLIDVAASQHPFVDGTWQEYDGPGRGSQWLISQRGDAIVAITADIRSQAGEKARWEASGFVWTGPRVLTYRYRFIEPPPGWRDGTHEVEFIDADTARVVWRDEDGRSGVVRLIRVTPSF